MAFAVLIFSEGFDFNHYEKNIFDNKLCFDSSPKNFFVFIVAVLITSLGNSGQFCHICVLKSVCVN
jgi:hypothetical protein